MTLEPSPRLWGFSILEISIVILLFSLFSLQIYPLFSRYLMRRERTLILEKIHSVLEMARIQAFIQGKTLIICPSKDQATCQSGEDWSHGFIVIEKSQAHQNPSTALPITHDRILKENSSPTILYAFAGVKFGKIHFSAFHNHLQSGIEIKPNGMTINNGTFIYCPHNKNSIEARGLVVNQAARSYSTEENAEKQHALYCR